MHPPTRPPARAHLDQRLDDRQRKRERLAAARLGAADDVPAAHDGLQHLLLDLEQAEDAARRQGIHGLLGEAEVGHLHA